MVAMKFKATLGSWSGVGVVLYMLSARLKVSCFAWLVN